MATPRTPGSMCDGHSVPGTPFSAPAGMHSPCRSHPGSCCCCHGPPPEPWEPYLTSPYENLIVPTMPWMYKLRWALMKHNPLCRPIPSVGRSLGEMLLLGLLAVEVVLFTGSWALNINMLRGDVYKTGKAVAYFLMMVYYLAMHNNVISLLVFGLSFERTLTFHKAIAYTTLVHSLLHGISFYLPGRNISIVDPYERSHLKFLPTTRLATAEISGWLLLFAIAIIVLTATPYFQHRDYARFFQVHVVLAFFAPFLALTHGYGAVYRSLHFLSWFGRRFSFWFVDIAIRILFMNCMVTTKRGRLTCIASPDGTDSCVVRISLPRAKRVGLRARRWAAGQWAFICVPKLGNLGLLHWHPATISSSGRDPELTFHLGCSYKDANSWTTKLAQEARKSDGTCTVLVEGPYGAPLVDVHSDRFKCFLVVSSGVGWTFLRAWKRQLLQEAVAGRPICMLHAVAVVRQSDRYQAPEFDGWDGLDWQVGHRGLTVDLEERLYLTGGKKPEKPAKDAPAEAAKKPEVPPSQTTDTPPGSQAADTSRVLKARGSGSTNTRILVPSSSSNGHTLGLSSQPDDSNAPVAVVGGSNGLVPLSNSSGSDRQSPGITSSNGSIRRGHSDNSRGSQGSIQRGHSDNSRGVRGAWAGSSPELTALGQAPHCPPMFRSPPVTPVRRSGPVAEGGRQDPRALQTPQPPGVEEMWLQGFRAGATWVQQNSSPLPQPTGDGAARNGTQLTDDDTVSLARRGHTYAVGEDDGRSVSLGAPIRTLANSASLHAESRIPRSPSTLDMSRRGASRGLSPPHPSFEPRSATGLNPGQWPNGVGSSRASGTTSPSVPVSPSQPSPAGSQRLHGRRRHRSHARSRSEDRSFAADAANSATDDDSDDSRSETSTRDGAHRCYRPPSRTHLTPCALHTRGGGPFTPGSHPVAADPWALVTLGGAVAPAGSPMMGSPGPVGMGPGLQGRGGTATLGDVTGGSGTTALWHSGLLAATPGGAGPPSETDTKADTVGWVAITDALKKAAKGTDARRLEMHGRPDWADLFNNAALTASAAGEHEVCVLICGNPAITADVRKQCDTSSSNGVTFHCHHENFGFNDFL